MSRTEAIKQWADLSAAGAEMLLARVPAGRFYYVVRRAEGADQARFEAHGKAFATLGLRRIDNTELYIRDVRRGPVGQPMEPENLSAYPQRIPGARIMAFDPDEHYVETWEVSASRTKARQAAVRPDAATRKSSFLETVEKDVRGKFEAVQGDEPTVRAGFNDALRQVVDGLPMEMLGALLSREPALFRVAMPTLAPGQSAVDAMRLSLAHALRTSFEPEVAERIEAGVQAAPRP